LTRKQRRVGRIEAHPVQRLHRVTRYRRSRRRHRPQPQKELDPSSGRRPLPPVGLAAWWLGWPRPVWRWRNGTLYGLRDRDGQRNTVVAQLERLAFEQGVRCRVVQHRHFQPPAAVPQLEGEAPQLARQAWRETQHLRFDTHSAETFNERDPRSRD